MTKLYTIDGKLIFDEPTLTLKEAVEEHQYSLIRANLSLADLKGIDLDYANLTEANLVGADLEGVDLSNADY